MKVRELIEELRKFDGEIDVFVFDEDRKSFGSGPKMIVSLIEDYYNHSCYFNNRPFRVWNTNPIKKDCAVIYWESQIVG